MNAIELANSDLQISLVDGKYFFYASGEGYALNGDKDNFVGSEFFSYMASVNHELRRLHAENEQLNLNRQDYMATGVALNGGKSGFLSPSTKLALKAHGIMAENEALKTENVLDKESLKAEEAHNKLLIEENEALKKDAARYRWLRVQHWSDSCLAVAQNPKSAIKLGYVCPSEERLDKAIDSAIESHHD